MVLNPITREVVELLKHENLELEHDVNGLGTRIAFALATIDPCALMHAVQVRSEHFPVNVLVQCDERVAHLRELLRALLHVEKSGLPVSRSHRGYVRLRWPCSITCQYALTLTPIA